MSAEKGEVLSSSEEQTKNQAPGLEKSDSGDLIVEGVAELANKMSATCLLAKSSSGEALPTTSSLGGADVSSQGAASGGKGNLMQSSSIDSSENSGDERLHAHDDDYEKKQEKQYQFILDMLQKEMEVKQKQKQRKAAVKALFKDEAEREAYGIKDKTIRFMTKHLLSYKKELRIKDGKLRKESDYVKVDDTWVQLSKLMFEPFREGFLNERSEPFATGAPTTYLEKVLPQLQKYKDIIVKAG